MELVLQCLSVLVLVGLVALFVRFGGRLFARTAIQWTVCFKYAVIVAVCLLVLSYLGLVGATATTGFWVGIVLVLAAQAAVGAIYLGPRVINQAGQSLGPLKAALVGAGAAILGLSFLAILFLVLGLLGLVRG